MQCSLAHWGQEGEGPGMSSLNRNDNLGYTDHPTPATQFTVSSTSFECISVYTLTIVPFMYYIQETFREIMLKEVIAVCILPRTRMHKAGLSNWLCLLGIKAKVRLRFRTGYDVFRMYGILISTNQIIALIRAVGYVLHQYTVRAGHAHSAGIVPRRKCSMNTSSYFCKWRISKKY